MHEDFIFHYQNTSVSCGLYVPHINYSTNWLELKNRRVCDIFLASIPFRQTLLKDIIPWVIWFPWKPGFFLLVCVVIPIRLLFEVSAACRSHLHLGNEICQSDIGELQFENNLSIGSNCEKQFATAVSFSLIFLSSLFMSQKYEL